MEKVIGGTRGAWSEVSLTPACIVTLVDRHIHRAEVIDIYAESYRLKEAKELNVPERSSAARSTDPTSPVNFTGTSRVLHRLLPRRCVRVAMPIHRVAGIGSNKDFDQGLSITGSNNTVAAVGNWWIPNAQGAGQDGTYDTRQTLTSGEGPNIYSSDIGVTIDL